VGLASLALATLGLVLVLVHVVLVLTTLGLVLLVATSLVLVRGHFILRASIIFYTREGSMQP